MSDDGSPDQYDAPTVTVERRDFCIVPHWVYSLGQRASHTYGCLVRFADNDSGDCWPRLSKVADFGGVGVAALRAGIRDLEEIGAVVVTPRFDATGVQRSNRYHLRYTDPRVPISIGQGADSATPELDPGELDLLSGANAPDGSSVSPFDTSKNGSPASPASAPAREAEPSRPDVREIVGRIAEHVAEQTGRVPRLPKATWSRDVRLLLDADGVTPDDAVRIIEWLRGPGGARFWSAVILSPKKFRHHFPALRAEAARASNGHHEARQTVGDLQEMAARFAAQETGA